MAWVVDTCLPIDVVGAEPAFGVVSATRLEGLAIRPVAYPELAQVFSGAAAAQGGFLGRIGATGPGEWNSAVSVGRKGVWTRPQ